MSNPNPGSSAGGIGPHVSERGEAPSDPDWNDQSDPINGKGMTPDDAASSAFDDWDTGQHGIAEGNRVEIGQHLKYHADSAGVSVVDGLDALIEPARILRHGSMQEKRQLVGGVIDDYNVQPVPVVQSEAPEYGPPAAGADGQPVSEAEAEATVAQFISSNPAAQDEQIQSDMTNIVQNMWQQGYRPGAQQALGEALQIAIEHQAEQVGRARAASGQVTGASPASAANQASDDLGDIIGSLTPNW